jgi:bacteriorhodopsin
MFADSLLPRCVQVLEQLAESLAPTACTTIEEVGSTGVGALTIAFLILGVSTIVFITRVGSAKGQKVYYYCNVFICGFACMSYFAMLSGQGWTAIAGCRQFFYARYVDWSITTPLLLLDLGLIAGADGALIAAVIGCDSEFNFLLLYFSILHVHFKFLSTLRIQQRFKGMVSVSARACGIVQKGKNRK